MHVSSMLHVPTVPWAHRCGSCNITACKAERPKRHRYRRRAALLSPAHGAPVGFVWLPSTCLHCLPTGTSSRALTPPAACARVGAARRAQGTEAALTLAAAAGGAGRGALPTRGCRARGRLRRGVGDVAQVSASCTLADWAGPA